MNNILIVGVGGQGIILASNLLARSAMKAGWDVKKSEVHGMAQRGGSVVSHIRIGEKVFSPLIPDGDVDLILAFEKLEALRWVHLLKRSGKIIVNDREIPPLSSLAGVEEYPAQIKERLSSRASIFMFSSEKIAAQAGHIRAVNVVVLGGASLFLPIAQNLWEETIRETVPPKTVDINIKAFNLGRKAVEEILACGDTVKFN